MLSIKFPQIRTPGRSQYSPSCFHCKSLLSSLHSPIDCRPSHSTLYAKILRDGIRQTPYERGPKCHRCRSIYPHKTRPLHDYYYIWITLAGNIDEVVVIPWVRSSFWVCHWNRWWLRHSVTISSTMDRISDLHHLRVLQTWASIEVWESSLTICGGEQRNVGVWLSVLHLRKI